MPFSREGKLFSERMNAFGRNSFHGEMVDEGVCL